MSGNFPAMDMISILQRIQNRIDKMNADGAALTERSVSVLATGSADTIRNWRRSARAGKTAGATLKKLTQVADALKVTPDWLITGDGPVELAEDSLVDEIVELLHELEPEELQMLRAAALGLRDQRHKASS